MEWAPSVMAGPLTTSLRGLWVSGFLPPGNGGPSIRAATQEPTMRFRGRLGPQAGNPKRSRLNCHTKRYSRTSVGVAPRGGDPKTPVREGEGTREPWRRGATGCRRLSRQLLVCGQGLQRGETMDNDFALAEATACRAARTIFHIPRW